MRTIASHAVSITIPITTGAMMPGHELAAMPMMRRSSANTGQTMQVTGQGLSNSLLARFPTTADDGTTNTATAPLFGVDAGGTVGSVVVPGTASTGSIRLETATGVSIPGQVSVQIVPTIDSLSVPQGQTVAPGVVATISGSGSDEAR